MRVIVTPDIRTLGESAARVLADVVAADNGAVIGLATGASATPVYEALAEWQVDFFNVTAFALDEYVGLPPGHPQSYSAVLRRSVMEPLGMQSSRLHVPNVHGANLHSEARNYEQRIAAVGGIDVQLLGIGANGHIGFNEPGSSLSGRTRLAALAESTRRANARFFQEPAEVPRWCMTQGVGTIREARSLLLVAFGSAKAAAVAQALEGPITALCPASAVQLHPDVTVVVDESAAANLRLRDHYRAQQIVGVDGRGADHG